MVKELKTPFRVCPDSGNIIVDSSGVFLGVEIINNILCAVMVDDNYDEFGYDNFSIICDEEEERIVELTEIYKDY
jgi:hypothetical protein